MQHFPHRRGLVRAAKHVCLVLLLLLLLVTGCVLLLHQHVMLFLPLSIVQTVISTFVDAATRKIVI